MRSLSVSQAAQQLDVSPDTVRRWADRGFIRAARTPTGYRRFAAEEIAALRRQIVAEKSSDD